MSDQRQRGEGEFNDEQGTKIAGDPTGAGSEATQGNDGKPSPRNHEHHSAYGGKAGEPKESNDGSDVPRSRR